MRTPPRNPRRTTRFAPALEQLEDRSVPAGNLTAAVMGNVLYVTGDDAGEAIWVAGVGKNRVGMVPLTSDTTINGQTGPLFFDGVRDGVVISLGNGNNALAVSGDIQGNPYVSTGTGNDELAMPGLHAEGASWSTPGAATTSSTSPRPRSTGRSSSRAAGPATSARPAARSRRRRA